MKKLLKKAFAALAVAVGFTTAAAAATPTVVWEGDFDTTSKVGADGLTYTLDLQGNSFADGVVTIDQTVGATITPSARNFGKVSVLIKYSNLAAISGKKPVLATAYNSVYEIGLAPHTAGGLDLNGFYDNASTRYGLNQNSGDNNTDTLVSVPAGSGYFMLTQNRATNGGGTTGYAGATLAEMANVGKSTKLKWDNNNLGTVAIGGTRVERNSYPSWTGVKIEKVALFYGSELTAADIANFQWPSERPTYKSVLSVNFGESAYDVAAGTDPYAIVGDSNWYNLNGNNITDAQAGTAYVSYGGGGTYRNGGKAQKFLQSYVDDGSTVNISITNLTGVAYDVYVYCSSDNADGWPYKTVNGANYYALANGEATLGTETWGNNTAGFAALGSNVMVIRGVVPGADGSITISSTRIGTSLKRGCIAAIQLGEVEKVIPKAFTLDLSESVDWSEADWSPTLPEEGMAPDATATVTAFGYPTLTLDGTITVGTLKIVSGEDNMLTIKKAADATTSIGTFDVSEATDGVTFDCKDGFTACHALTAAARDGNYKFYFLGEGENGALLDYGTAAYDNNTIQGHYIFEDGVHTFQKVSESQGLEFAANATLDNPTFWVKDGTTLNWKARNPCGWNATASAAGIVRIGEGSKVVPMNADANAGTWYWSQQFYLEDGATLEIGTTDDNFRTVGNDAEKPHFVVPEGASAEITGGTDNFFALPSNSGGAAVFDVEVDATLTVSAKLKTLANGKPLVKYGEGVLKVTSDVSAFNGAIQVKAGTLEYATATALGANATIAVDAVATFQIDAEEDATFAKAVSGSGSVVKAGEGTLTVTAGAFGDNSVSITGGAIKFTATGAQAKAGVVLCKAEEDISEIVTVVNEAGEALVGVFTFEGNTLSFKLNCVDVSFTLDSDTNWSDVAESLGWINSPESTLTVTCGTSGAELRFDQEIIAKSIKIVSGEGADIVIPDGSFQYMQIASYDFTEAEGGVTISFEDLETGELRLVTGVPIAGFANVRAEEDTVPEGYGFYADATHIWLCKTIEDVTRTSPTTEDVQAYTNFFVGVVSGDWADKANWRTAKDGLLVPYQYEKYPQSTEAQNPNWYPACFDGEIIEAYKGNKEITCAAVEGWETKLDFRNGVEVTIDHMKKFANNFMWIDSSSSVSITKLGGSTFQYGYIFNVAGQLTIGTFEGNIANIPYTYNLGDEAVVTYTDGVKSGTRHAIDGGKLVAEGDGIAVPVTITNSVAITTPALAAVTIHPDSTLTLTSSAEGDLTIGGNWTNNGMLDVAAGTVVFKPGVTPGEYATSDGKVIIGQQVTINDCGKIAVSGATVDDVRLFDIGGNPVAITKVEGGYAFYEWDVTGKNCWWDYEFDGNLASEGTDTTTMTAEGQADPYNEDDTAIRVGYGTPYRSVTYPEQFTAVLYGKMVNNQGHMEVGFGSTYTGSKLAVILACGDPSQDEVKLLVTSGYAVTETISMRATDIYDTDHLYAFTCQTVADGGTEKTRVSVYLDGAFLQSYTFDGKVTLGPGFQIGSVFGGNLSGYSKATTANENAELDFLRVYQTVLTAEAMAKYAEKYPYTSKGGKSERTFDDSLDQTWVAAPAANLWTVTPFEEESFPTNSALAGSQVTISASADAEVTMNLAEATIYESLAVGEGFSVTFKAGEDAVEPTITGGTTIKANVTVDYDAVKFGTVEVAAGQTLTFDFTGYPFDTYYADATIPFTGATSGEGTITAKGLPEAGVRTVTFEKNTSTDQYELKIAVTPTPFVYTIAASEETGVWTWGEQEVTEATVDANPSVVIQKEGDGTLQKDLADRVYVVNGGLFTTMNAANRTATITVNGLSTFDYNGSADGFITVNLKGGTLLNTGNAIGTGSRQMQGLTVTADSTVGGTGDFGLIAGGYAANTLELGGKSLTKTGTNAFYLNHTTVTNGKLNVTEGSIRVTGQPVVFADDAALVLASGTTLTVENPLTIGAITASEATINNTSSITPFTLTGSATLTGNGTWGTNNIDGATVTIGEKRDFVFAGNGSVNVALTAAEYDGGMPITLFTNDDGAASVVGKVFYNDEDITSKCTISGNQITAITKGSVRIGTTYYLTLADANAAAEAGNTIELLADASGDGIFVSKDVTFDFGGFTYTVTGNPVGSTGTLSQGFHVETANCTLTNGTITSTSGSGVKMLVQNYASLTLKDLTLDGTNLDVGFASGDYVLSNNSGEIVLDNVTINAQADDYAFDVDKTATVTLNSGTINGKIAVTGAGPLTINGGTINGPANGKDYDGKAVITVDGGTLAFNAGTLNAYGEADCGMYGVYVKNGGTATFGTTEAGPSITSWFAAIGANNTTAGEGVSITVNGGSYTQLADGTGTGWAPFCAAVYAPAAGIYTINGGTFTGGLYCLASPYANVGQTITFDGGTFNQPLYVAEGTGVGEGARTITKADSVTLAAPAGYMWDEYGELVKLPVAPEVTVETYAGELPEGLDTAYTYTMASKGSGYDAWNVDYFVSFDKDIAADTVTLKGQYGTYEWQGSALSATAAGTEIQLVAALGKTINVGELAAIGAFNCGVGDTGANAGTKMTVVLKMFKDGEDPITLDTQTYTFEAKFQPLDPTQEDEIECKDEDAATVLAAAITLDPALYIKAPAGVTGNDATKYQAMYCGRAFENYVYIELTNQAVEDLQKEVNGSTVTETVAASLVDPAKETVTITTTTPGFYYWVEGAETPDFEDSVQGPALLSKSDAKSLTLTKTEMIGLGDKQFYKIAVGTKDPHAGE